jgi:hypothetical protein
LVGVGADGLGLGSGLGAGFVSPFSLESVESVFSLGAWLVSPAHAARERRETRPTKHMFFMTKTPVGRALYRAFIPLTRVVDRRPTEIVLERSKSYFTSDLG